MNTATLAHRQTHPDRSAPHDEPRAADMDTALEIAAAIQYATSRTQVLQHLADLRVCIGDMTAEAYGAGRLAGLVAMGRDRGMQS